MPRKNNPADRVERWPLDRIREYPGNPRTHSEAELNLLASAMRERGVTAAVLDDEDGVLIAGHGRLEAARRAGLKELPVNIAHGWSEEQKRAHRIWDNQSVLMAAWNMPLLKGEVAALADFGYDMPLLGFDEKNLLTIRMWGDPLGDMPALPNGDRAPFQQMTFTVHDGQAEKIKQAIAASKAMGKFNGPNENSNGNALARICERFLAQSKGHRRGADRPARGKRGGVPAALQRQGH